MRTPPKKLGDLPDFAELRGRGFAGVQCRKLGLMIAMTARTGSSHLCAALEAAGDTGRPSEIFNPRGVLEDELIKRGVASFAAYIESFNREPSRYFVFKTAWQDFASVASEFRSLFPNLDVLYLDRRHDCEQAVSLYRAQASGLWHRHKRETAVAAPLVAFNPQRIADILVELEREKSAWEGYFAAQGIRPLRLFYETIAQDVRAAVAFIAAQTGMELGRPIGPDVGYVKLADNESAEWVERMLRQELQLT